MTFDTKSLHFVRHCEWQRVIDLMYRSNHSITLEDAFKSVGKNWIREELVIGEWSLELIQFLSLVFDIHILEESPKSELLDAYDKLNH